MNRQDKHSEIRLECIPEVLKYIDFFKDIKEEDYIRYGDDHGFEYTPQFYGFIQALFDAGLVENYEKLIEFVAMGSESDIEKCELFSQWMKEMNKKISRPCEMRDTDIHFLRRAFLTVIRMEKIFPGSWGIDVETGTWIRLLKQLKFLHDSGDLKVSE